MADEDEMRRLAEALLAERKSAAVAPKRKKVSAAKRKKGQIAARKARTRKLAKRGLPVGFAERDKKRKTFRRGARPAQGGYSLVERLLARTDPVKWYTHAQLLRLLPESGKDGMHAILYQKMPRLGLIERRALIAFPDHPWLCDEKGVGAGCAATQSRYVYRIGAQADKKRALAREKEAAATLIPVEG